MPATRIPQANKGISTVAPARITFPQPARNPLVRPLEAVTPVRIRSGLRLRNPCFGGGFGLFGSGARRARMGAPYPLLATPNSWAGLAKSRLCAAWSPRIG